MLILVDRIWERQFGKEANHVKKSAHAEELAKATVEAKKLARVKKGNEPRLPPSTFPQAIPISTKRQGEKMHPSWEAKRKAQELASTALATAGKGKKIVF